MRFLPTLRFARERLQPRRSEPRMASAECLVEGRLGLSSFSDARQMRLESRLFSGPRPSSHISSEPCAFLESELGSGRACNLHLIAGRSDWSGLRWTQIMLQKRQVQDLQLAQRLWPGMTRRQSRECRWLVELGHFLALASGCRLLLQTQTDPD